MLAEKLKEELSQWEGALIKVAQDADMVWVEISYNGRSVTSWKIVAQYVMNDEGKWVKQIVEWAERELSRFFVTMEVWRDDRIGNGDLVYNRRIYANRAHKVKVTKDGVRRINGSAFGPEEDDRLYASFRKAQSSPAMELFNHFLEAQCDRITSWDTRTRLATEIVILIIRARVEFWKEDFLTLNKHTSDLEYLYRIALTHERGNTINNSAVKALEYALNRTPFILDGNRLYIGCRFRWLGADVECTSIQRVEEKLENGWRFRDSHLVACSYQWIKDGYTGYGEKKLLKVYKIYHKDIPVIERISGTKKAMTNE